MLGIKKGISYLENDDDGLAFRKPYHRNVLIDIRFGVYQFHHYWQIY